jgi:pimeloyl-ACP methyl ester carboxylesterase
VLSAYSVFLFSPSFARDNPEKVSEWIGRAAAMPMQPRDVDISLRRIDMIAAHYALPRLAHIAQPTLVICGAHDFCTPGGGTVHRIGRQTVTCRRVLGGNLRPRDDYPVDAEP